MYENFWQRLMSFSPFDGNEELPQPKAMTEAPMVTAPSTDEQLGLMRKRLREAKEKEKIEVEREKRLKELDAMNKVGMYTKAIQEANKEKRMINGIEVPPPRPDFPSTTLQQLIDQYESGGDYNALLGNSQKGRFSNIKVSNMTIGEIKEFAKEYGAWSKDFKRKNPQFGSSKVMSTPMGRYQFVLTTMLENANKMGLDDSTVFSPEVQDKMFDFEVRKRLGNVSESDMRRKSIRSGWIGLEKSHDRLLDYAIENYLKGMQ